MNAEGFTIECCIQGAKTLSLPMRMLGVDLQAKRVVYNNNPILKRCLTNTQIAARAVAEGNDQSVCQNRPSGATPEVSWEIVTVLPTPSAGGCWIPNISESRRDVRESSLFAILEGETARKYYLSAKACQGIMDRARRKNKVLPPLLKEALRLQILITA